MKFSASVLDDILNEVYSHLLGQEVGGLKGTRGDGSEEIGVLIELTNPRARLSSSENRGRIFSALGELCWYLSGSESLKQIEYYIPAYKKETEDGETISGAYGPRIFGTPTKDKMFKWNDQLSTIIKRLGAKETRETKRAVVTIFDRTDLVSRFDYDLGRKEVPCTISFQFLVRRGKLHMITNMRSNDAYFGLPHDVFTFTMIQEIVARSIGCSLGTYKHFVGSLHLYDESREKAEKYLEEGLQSTAHEMPRMPSGCQLNRLGDFLVLEDAIRLGKRFAEKEVRYGSYWGDLAVLLLAYKKVRERSPKGDITQLVDKLKYKIYAKYIQEKLKPKSLDTNIIDEKQQLKLLNETEYDED